LRPADNTGRAPWRQTALAALLAAAGACTSADVDRTERAGGPTAAAPSLTGTPGCFFARDVQDFRVLGTSSLLVFAPGPANAFQVTISPAAWDLRSAFGIAFTGSGGRICGAAGDRLIVNRGGGQQRFSVVAVNALDRAAVDRLTGRGQDRQAPPPSPESTPGAVIESDPDDATD
jgi:hypothetical protein